MSTKRIMGLTMALILSFLAPLILISFWATPPLEMTNQYRNMWAEGVPSYLNAETLGIILNNLFVMFVMCLFSILPFKIYYRKEREDKDFKQAVCLITGSYCMYFIKEGARAGFGLLSFPYATYWFGVIILVFPHGIIEIGGFALTASTMLEYYKTRDIKVLWYLLISVILIIIAGVFETTLTPYLFRTFL